MNNVSNLSTGLLHRDLEPALISEIQALKSADPLHPIVVLIGSRLLADYLGWHFAEKELNLFNLRFVTFAELSDDLSLKDRLNDSRSILPPHAEFLYLLDAVSNLKTPHYFDKVSARFSFIRTLKASFDDLDDSLVDRIDALVAKPQDRTDKLTVLAELRSHYQDNISRFRRPLDNLISPDNLKKAFVDAYNTNHLIVYGFYDFNAAQRAFLASLARELKFSVYIPWCEGDVTGSAFKFAQPTVKFFEKLIPCAPSRSKETGQRGASVTSSPCHPIAGFYGHRLFNFGVIEEESESTQKDKLTVFNASDLASEIRSIVGRINEAALYDQTPLSKIGIILWHPDNYLPLLKHELEKAGLPFFDAIGEALTEALECRAFLSLLDMCDKKIERKTLVDLIASYDLKIGKTDKEIEPDPVAWEAISIETGIVEGDLQNWLTQLDYVGKRDDLKQQAGLFGQFIESLFIALGKLPDNDEWDNFVNNAVQLAEDFLPDNENTDQILEILKSTSGSTVAKGKIERSSFISIITELFKKTKTSQSGRFRADGITICDRMTSRGVAFDLVFIPGLTQGAVPVKPHDDPFLNDSDRILLNKALFNQDYSTSKQPLHLPLKSSMLDEERLLFALTVDSAEKQLYLSYPDRNLDGRKLLPSRFLLEMCRVVTGKPVETEKISELDFFEDDTQLSINDQNEKLMRTAVDKKRFIIDKILQNTNSDQQSEAFKQAYSRQSAQYQRGFKTAFQRVKGTEFTVWDGVMPEGWNQQQLIPISFSASALESYAACPFAYFISHILKATEWEEPEMLFEPPPQAIGSLIHKILEQFYIKIRETGNLPISASSSGHSEAELESIISENIKASRARYPAPRALWDIEEQRTFRRLKAFLKSEINSENDFRFADAEVAVKQELTLKTDTVPFSFNLTGKIDRIDMSPDGKSIKIIDYKTGSAPSKPEDFKSGTCLQLPLYLLAALKTYPDALLLESSAEFLKIGSEGEVKSISMSGEWLEDNEAELGKIVRVLISAIRSGLFLPIPEKNKCSRCEAQYLCDFRSRKSYEYKKNDSRLDGLREIGCLE